MKRIMQSVLLAIVMVAFLLSGAWASEEKKGVVCKSKYRFPSNCTACHLPPFGEVGDSIGDWAKSYVIREKNHLTILAQAIDFSMMWKIFIWIEKRNLKKITIDLFSFGGSTFDAMAIGQKMQRYIANGGQIEIRASGLVASAGIILLVSGSPGMRFIEKDTLVMWHEGRKFKLYSFESATDEEENAKISRMIENQVNQYVASKSKVSSDELSKMIKYKELWCTADEAVEKFGFADKVLR